MELIPDQFDLGQLTTEELAGYLAGDRPVVVLLPVGAVEPHGPHLALLTDIVISQGAATRAAATLDERGLTTFIAPAISYGVTNSASQFKGAVSVAADTFSAYLGAVVGSLLEDGFAHVCVINNHLEPEHDSSVRSAVAGFDEGLTSVACPLTRRWGRTLSDEFKSGACHAGEYETSIVMASAPRYVRERERSGLPEVPVSLSDKLRDGISDFKEMGLLRAYAGAPARATAKHGSEQLDKLAAMIVTEVFEALDRR